ncbi:MAG: cytochrome c [Pirellulales bacterium]|nr:cytochrome c [Pirellulales bacterium]
MIVTQSTTRIVVLTALVLVVVAFVSVAAAAEAEPPAAPPVSQFAPAEDLVGQVKYYLKRLEQAVETEDDYKDFIERIAKDTDTLAVIALALGLHDTDNAYKAAASEIIQATQQLAAAKDYATAKVAVENVKKAATAKTADASNIKWEKVASLKQLMLAVPPINTQLKRNIKLRRPKRDGPKAAGRAAVIAVIGQAALYHSDDTEKPELAEKWYDYCFHMRDAAAEANAAARRTDKAAVPAAMEKLAKSCDDCHTVFHQEALGKEDVEEEDD